MSQEIIEHIRGLEREKGIEENTVIHALEDALLAAYKKTPGAARHATVELDEEGEFRVFAIEIPEDLEARLLDEAMEAKIDELEHLEEETGEKQHTLINPDELDLDWSQVPEQQIDRTDVTPTDFGRIAGMTAKQVFQQRIREAERAIMYDEYVDRQGEVVTGIVQQAGDRNNVLVDLGKVEALLPRSEQVDGERYEQGSRIKAVIVEKMKEALRKRQSADYTYAVIASCKAEPSLNGLNIAEASMKVRREEIFGPVLCATRFSSEDDADRLARLGNETEYGLAASIWTRDIGMAHRLARRLKSGTIRINGAGGVDPASPLGGYKASGWGRENGKAGIEAYTELKSVSVALD